MKIINQSGYTPEERAAHTSIVQSNAVTSMQMLLDGVDKCHIEKPADLAALQAQFAADFAETETLTPESSVVVGQLWAHAAVQQARPQPQSLRYYISPHNPSPTSTPGSPNPNPNPNPNPQPQP